MNLKKILIPATIVTFIFTTTAFAAPSNQNNEQAKKPLQKVENTKNAQNGKSNQSVENKKDLQASKLDQLVRKGVITSAQKSKIQHALNSKKDNKQDLKSILNSLVRSKVINKYQADKVYVELQKVENNIDNHNSGNKPKNQPVQKR
jgi:hypothetical protein